jgi:hypothetical protein
MEYDKVIRMKFAGLLVTLVVLSFWGLWNLMLVE